MFPSVWQRDNAPSSLFRFLLQRLPVVLLFLIFFCIYTTPLEDGDFFWHLRTGQWIWEHKGLPSADFFSQEKVTAGVTSPELQRISFTLKQYWLGQLALYGVWEMAGSAGIVLLRALSYTAILAFLYWWMRKKGGGILPLLVVFLMANVLSDFPSERPQLFTFIFTPLALYLLENLTTATTSRPRSSMLLLPLLMLAWANIHGGYVVGIILVLIYLAAAVFSRVTRRQAVSGKTLLILVISIAATLINPCGVRPLAAAIFSLSGASASNLEFLSPLRAMKDLGEYFPYYWAFLILASAMVIGAGRAIQPVHVLAILALSVLSLTGLRYMPFPFFAAPLLIPPPREWERSIGKVVPLLLVVLLSATANWKLSFSFRPHELFPEKGVGFIRDNLPAAQLFNYYDWGGYLMCQLPTYKVFVDGRGLYEAAASHYEQAMFSEKWNDLFDRYDINTVILPGASDKTGATYPLVEQLVWDRNWQLVYRDDVSLVFVRNIATNRDVIGRHSMDKREVYRHLILLSNHFPQLVQRTEFWTTRGNAHYMLGNRQEARQSFEKALTMKPDNEWARRMLIQLGP